MLIIILLSVTFSVTLFLLINQGINFWRQQLQQERSRRFLFQVQNASRVKLFKQQSLFQPYVILLIAVAVIGLSVFLNFFSGLLAFLLLLLLNYLWQKHQEKRQLELFWQQIPLIIKYLMNGLAAGYSLLQALAYTAQNVPSPSKEALDGMVEQMRLGASLEDAFADLYTKIKLEDLKILFLTILVQKKTGGNLVDILKATHALLLERQSLKNDLLTQTAQVRFSSSVVGVMPLVVLLFMLVTDPAYISPLWQSLAGQLMLIFALLAELAGYLVIKKLLAVKI